MKKIISCLTLALIALFATGCSCSETAALSFDNLWKGENIGYKESLVYTVSYSSDYNEFGYSFVKSDYLSGFTVDIGGTYTAVNEILSREDPTIPQSVKNCESYNLIPTSSSVVKSTAKLDLTATYAYGDKTETSTDYIYSTSYFYNVQASLAPIYTERELSYSYPSVSGNDFKLTQLTGKDFAVYSEKKYVITTEYGETEETEYEYEFRTLIDNSSLLLAVRNKTLDKDASYTLPTVHPSYKAAQSLRLTHYADAEKEITFKYNGETTTVKFNVNGLSFVVGSINNSGMAQVAFVQSGEQNGIDKSLMVEYVAPLVENGGFNKMGALIYTLAEATYS